MRSRRAGGRQVPASCSRALRICGHVLRASFRPGRRNQLCVLSKPRMSASDVNGCNLDSEHSRFANGRTLCLICN